MRTRYQAAVALSGDSAEPGINNMEQALNSIRSSKRSKYEKCQPNFVQLTDTATAMGVSAEEAWSRDPQAWEIEEKSLDEDSRLRNKAESIFDERMPIEVALHLLSFLDLPSLRNIKRVNRTLRKTLESTDSESAVWMSRYREKWPFLMYAVASELVLDPVFATENPFVLSANENKDTKVVANPNIAVIPLYQSEMTVEDTVQLNHSLLLSLSPVRGPPTQIDETQMLLIQKRIQQRRRRQNQHHRRIIRNRHRIRHFPPVELGFFFGTNGEMDNHSNFAVDDDDDDQQILDRRLTVDRNDTIENELKEIQFVSLRTSLESDCIQAVQYSGPIGQGDRCIRANEPLPRPVRQTNHRNNHKKNSSRTRNLLTFHDSDEDDDADDDVATNSVHSSMTVGLVMLQSLIARLQRESAITGLGILDDDNQNGNRNQRYYHEHLNRVLHLLSQHHATECSVRSNSVFRPFAVPFRSSNHKFQLTPRLISYYEVSIHPANSIITTATEFTTSSVLRPTPVNFWAERVVRTRSECVAVGLATSDFDLLDRMPGWDRNSIGYHGDDGGLFYGTGSMSRRIGPSFGVGDTVGCGIDYSNCNDNCVPSVFFTLNGTFLGYEPIRSEYLLHRDLFPVIGIDTNSPISCNFGIAEPFKFDLMELVRKQKKIIVGAFQKPVEANAKAINPASPTPTTASIAVSLGDEEMSVGSWNLGL